jgi:hypothetical protein
VEKQLLAAAAIVLLAAGCGGAHQATPSLSRSAFVSATDRICAEATTHGSRLARLRALRPPVADADLFAHWLTAERDARTAAKALADHTTSSKLDPDVALAIAEGKIAGYASRLGARTCAKRTIGTMPP